MAVDIYVFDRSRRFVKILEHINADTIQLLTAFAEKNNFKCASYIYYMGNTIFNQKQLQILKNEIEQFRAHDTLNQNDIASILSCIDKAQQDKFYYLMFIGE